MYRVGYIRLGCDCSQGFDGMRSAIQVLQQQQVVTIVVEDGGYSGGWLGLGLCSGIMLFGRVKVYMVLINHNTRELYLYCQVIYYITQLTDAGQRLNFILT